MRGKAIGMLLVIDRVVVQQPDAWGWTPTTVAAGATALLAVLTAALAWSTRRLAKATREDVRSEFRPILIGSATGEDGSAALEVEPAMLGTGRASLILFLTNVGPGPAMNIKVTPKSFGFLEDSQGATVERGSLGPGEKNIHQSIRFEDEAFYEEWPKDAAFGYSFEVAYEDLNEHSYKTFLRYERKVGETVPGTQKIFKIRVVDTKVS
jgi:hypothetical protein